jgi:hypothetical protein
MFLPPEALGGIPCVSIPQDSSFDPGPTAARLAAEVPPPDLRIKMNPDKGLVNVPTWFWVEGYDGGTLSAAETVLQEHEVCHTVPVRTPGNGLAQLDDAGRPATRLDCTTTNTTFDVEVRLYPEDFAWDFGDHSSPRSVPCAGVGDCSNAALGSPYVDALHASPIQHPYPWSSLGINSPADAYVVKLDVAFAAEYRVSVDGQAQGGWHGLPARTLSWSAAHQVQEAQAVLVRPCPVSLAHC